MNAGLFRGSLVAAAFVVSLTLASSRAEDRPTRDDVRHVFRAFAPEYYRRFYAWANAQTFVPGENLGKEERDARYASLRRRSELWAEAFQEVLVLDSDQTFVLEFRDLVSMPDKVPVMSVIPEGAWTKWSGRWARTGTTLRLTVWRINGLPVASPVDWVAVWIRREVVIPNLRQGYAPAVMHEVLGGDVGTNQVLDRNEDASQRCVSISSTESRLGRLAKSITGLLRFALGEKHRKASQRSAFADNPHHWLQVLRGPNEAQWTEAAVELVRLHSTEAATTFMKILDERRGEGEVRVVAANALGEWRVVDSVPTLIRSLQDEDRVVRLSSMYALESVTGHHIEVEGSDRSEEEVASWLQSQWSAWWAENEASVRASHAGS